MSPTKARLIQFAESLPEVRVIEANHLDMTLAFRLKTFGVWLEEGRRGEELFNPNRLKLDAEAGRPRLLLRVFGYAPVYGATFEPSTKPYGDWLGVWMDNDDVEFASLVRQAYQSVAPKKYWSS